MPRQVEAQIVDLLDGKPKIVGSFPGVDPECPNVVTSELLELYPGAEIIRGKLVLGEKYVVSERAAIQAQTILALIEG